MPVGRGLAPAAKIQKKNGGTEAPPYKKKIPHRRGGGLPKNHEDGGKAVKTLQGRGYRL